MAHLLPRKIKKACNSCLDNTPMKTKWMRHVHCQVSDFYYTTIGDYNHETKAYYTKYGELLDYMLDKLGQ